MEGFVPVRTLSIFDERLDESIEPQTGASNNAMPLSTPIILPVDHFKSRFSKQNNVEVFRGLTGVTNCNCRARETRPQMIKRVSQLGMRFGSRRYVVAARLDPLSFPSIFVALKRVLLICQCHRKQSKSVATPSWSFCLLQTVSECTLPVDYILQTNMAIATIRFAMGVGTRPFNRWRLAKVGIRTQRQM